MFEVRIYEQLVHSGWRLFHLWDSISGRNEGCGGGVGGGGVVKPPKCARKCANLRNLKANVQILDRKTPPPMVYPISPTGYPQCLIQESRFISQNLHKIFITFYGLS